MRYRFGGLVITLAVLLAGPAPGDDEGPGFRLFDGRSLQGWTSEHSDRFAARGGVIVCNGGIGWLRHNRPFRDFELQAEYRGLKKGGEGGVVFRATAESMARAPYWPAKGYQLQLRDNKNHFAIMGLGVAPPKFNRRANALKDAIDDPRDWQTITLRVVGKRAEAILNGTPITVSDTIERPEGCIGILCGSGHFEWRNLKLRELSAP